ncbi:hypothetical protein EIN_037810, partial [Entamoeba invadens IP1]
MLLEQVFLKNVVLYFETLTDVMNFLFLNKKCLETVTSLYVNSYALTKHHNFPQIYLFFPQMQTFYVETTLQYIKAKDARCMPLIEINHWTDKYFYRDRKDNVFTTQWFPPKIRKLCVYPQQVIKMFTSINFYTQLQSFFLNFHH